jgi:hypothetical protein
MAPYLNLLPVGNDGVWSKGGDESPKVDHTYWWGFKQFSAKGLRFETLSRKSQKNN